MTLEDALILHLIQYSKYENGVEAPYSATQPGIAEAVGIRRSHVSYVLKGLKQKGNVREKSAHIKDKARKRKTYFLTLDGNKLGLELKERLEQRTVTLLEGSGKREEESGSMRKVKICNISKILSKNIPFFQLLLMVSRDGVILADEVSNYDGSTIGSKPPGSGEAGHVNFIDNMAQPVRMLGRDPEKKKIKGWLEESLPRMIVIKGIAGMGKTTLVAGMIGELADIGDRSLYWQRFFRWDTLKGTLRELSEFLAKLGRNKLKFYLENEQDIDMQELGKIIELELADQSLLMVFDDVQFVSDDILQLFSLLVKLMERDKFKNINILILTRSALKFYDRRDVAVRKLVAELELAGLNLQASKKLIKSDRIEKGDIDKIHKITEGHPLSLELINIHLNVKTAEGQNRMELDEIFMGEHDLARYIREEIFHGLTQNERKVLELLSVFRYPVPAEALITDEEFDHSIIDTLQDKSVLIETTSGYEMHELIKEFFFRRLSPGRKVESNRNAAQFYSSEIDEAGGGEGPHAIFEGIYHFNKAGDHESAARLAAANGEDLISRGFIKEFNIATADLQNKEITAEQREELLLLNGQILTMEGRWDDAFSIYQDCLRSCEERNDREGLARAYNNCGAIYYRKGKWKDAMECYNKGTKIAEREHDDINCSKLFSNKALVHWGNGELGQAKKLLEKSLELSERLDDRKGISRAYNNLGILSWERGDFDDAIGAYETGLKLSKELDDKKTIAILYDNLGEVYRKKKMTEEAEAYYRKSLELSDQLGFKWQIAEVNCNLGQLYRENDREQSTGYLNTALKLYTDLGAEKEIEKIKIMLNQ